MKVTKKSFIGIIITVFCMVSVAMAECPSGTYPCTINGQDACCPKSAANGVRGSLDDQRFDEVPILLADNSSSEWDQCRQRCYAANANCMKNATGKGGELTRKHNACWNQEQRCLAGCNSMLPDRGPGKVIQK